ncbi:IucA/IucC family protein [Catenovulum sediminis]|uniref:IucA/IucC family protein n=1 Tax=Catenovulum sediminis TaxID=1740262 RepID=A0ABV1RD32_9ALTE|nr:IucA/IucC family protein [Catenovulum sediminis]
MQNNVISQKFQQTLLQEKAERRSMMNLINCYCREFAAQRNEITVNPNIHKHSWPEAFKTHLKKSAQDVLLINFPLLNSQLLVRVTALKKLGQCRHISAPYVKKTGTGWQKIKHKELTLLLLHNLAVAMDQPFNAELAQQINNSVNNSHLFLQYRAHADSQDASTTLLKNGFIRSEQNLLWGHAWHPTPKSREGVSRDILASFSPETGAHFQLRYLAVRTELIQSLNSVEFDGLDFLQTLSQLEVPTGYHVFVCHPFQLDKFSSRGLFQKAVKNGDIVQLGAAGTPWFPTSSVRTLYNNEADYFLKFSLHIRLTNCVRKNAWYELETAVYLNQILSRLQKNQASQFTHFQLMAEPSSVTLNFANLASQAQQDEVTELSEAFGILFRQSFSQAQVEKQQPRVAAALFTDDANNNSAIKPYIASLAKANELSETLAAKYWFEAYTEALLPPVLFYFFKLGIIFEPHLQNTVIGFDTHRPVFISLRDLEGTKLATTKWPEDTLSGLSQRAINSIYYDRAQGWRRIAYCLLINNISEAIFHLSDNNPELEEAMWQTVYNSIQNYQQQYGQEPELQKLLKGGNIPCKCNLMTRLLKHADRLAQYVELPNPMSTITCHNTI